MALENCSDKLTLKNLLFTKALPNYTCSEATDGYKIFPCVHCGDKFLFETSYNDHINRRSLKITFFCRYCKENVICQNRCRLLSHIRFHTVKTTTIYENDVQIEPLPLQDINPEKFPENDALANTNENPNLTKSNCYECKQIIEKTKNINVDKSKHYMRYTNMVYSCPICLFALPNTCSLAAHLRIHLRIPPYYCPECGVHLSSKCIIYPYNHNCEGFNMMRATTRLICKHKNCNKIFHPNDYRTHIKNHFKNTFKCVRCSQAWDEPPKDKHQPCGTNIKIVPYLECQLCLSFLVNRVQVSNHINMHFKKIMEKHKDHIYPCLFCSSIYNDISALIKHHIDKHAHKEIKHLLLKILNQYDPKNSDTGFYRVIKKCDKCSRSFIYRCEYRNIKILPSECPYKCVESNNNNKSRDNCTIVCYLCKEKISEDWENIKKHFASFHKNHKCIDPKVKLTRLDKTILDSKNKARRGVVKNNLFAKSRKEQAYRTNISHKSHNMIQHSGITNENFICNICSFLCQSKKSLESHIITHRDPCSAYQCLECGQCFVVKPSFTTHLLLEHGIENVNEYVNEKQCFNEVALLKQPSNKMDNEPLRENQCNICRDQFENVTDLEKHFRVHGMAFLMKNTNKSSSP